MDSVKAGTVTDAYGRQAAVWADKSGAVRLDFGSFDFMLTPLQWRFLVSLGTAALERGQQDA